MAHSSTRRARWRVNKLPLSATFGHTKSAADTKSLLSRRRSPRQCSKERLAQANSSVQPLGTPPCSMIQYARGTALSLFARVDGVYMRYRLIRVLVGLV